MSEGVSLFEQIGGRPTLERIAKRFYDKLYADEWMKHFFKNTRQEIIERQQVDFITGALGGPRIFSGRLPHDAHTHINITPEVYEKRKELLIEALREEHAPEILIERWLRVDEAFKNQIMKNSVTDCKKRWNTDEILDFPDPKAPSGQRRTG
jgi:truncated hemoglobin YjbI